MKKMKMTRINRYRLYFLLMDLTTILYGIGLVQFAADPGAIAVTGVEPSGIHKLIGLIGIGLPTFLIFASFMRDEFAERAWQNAAASTIKGLVLIPFIALFVAGIAQGYADAQRAAQHLPKLGPTMPLDAISGTTLFGWAWTLMLMLFIFAFQWHRWRGTQ